MLQIIIIILVITFMQGICNYIPEKELSRVYSVAAGLYLQLHTWKKTHLSRVYSVAAIIIIITSVTIISVLKEFIPEVRISNILKLSHAGRFCYISEYSSCCRNIIAFRKSLNRPVA
jgi:hypothetical protein